MPMLAVVHGLSVVVREDAQACASLRSRTPCGHCVRRWRYAQREEATRPWSGHSHYPLYHLRSCLFHVSLWLTLLILQVHLNPPVEKGTPKSSVV